jgi:hypothetical protein
MRHRTGAGVMMSKRRDADDTVLSLVGAGLFVLVVAVVLVVVT